MFVSVYFFFSSRKVVCTAFTLVNVLLLLHLPIEFVWSFVSTKIYITTALSRVLFLCVSN